MRNGIEPFLIQQGFLMPRHGAAWATRAGVCAFRTHGSGRRPNLNMPLFRTASSIAGCCRRTTYIKPELTIMLAATRGRLRKKRYNSRGA